MTYGDVLKRARELLTGDRDAVRGDPRPIYERAAALCRAAGIGVEAWQVAEMLMLVKLARILVGGHDPDNAVDMAAYVDIMAYLTEPQQPDSLAPALNPYGVGTMLCDAEATAGPPDAPMPPQEKPWTPQPPIT